MPTDWPTHRIGDNVLIQTTCAICGSHKDIVVPSSQWLKWQLGTHIQDAMPTLSVSDRERLITGTCNDCWQDMFPPDPDDPDDPDDNPPDDSEILYD